VEGSLNLSLPYTVIDIYTGARLQTINPRLRVVVAPVPFAQECPVIHLRRELYDLLKIVGGNRCRQRPPAVMVPQQDDEVGGGGGLLAALYLAQADFHGLLVEGGFFEDTPAQVDGLEAAAVGLAQLPQAGEDALLHGIALGYQVTEGG